MSKRLKVNLFPGWKTTEGPPKEYPYRFYREAIQPYGVLDVTLAEYKGGVIPNPSYDDLLKLATGSIESELVSRAHGDCDLGRCGTAQFRSSDGAYTQRWFSSNGRDFIIAEYHSHTEPSATELDELQEIVKSLKLAGD
jgi:hypothetical protein